MSLTATVSDIQLERSGAATSYVNEHAAQSTVSDLTRQQYENRLEQATRGKDAAAIALAHADLAEFWQSQHRADKAQQHATSAEAHIAQIAAPFVAATLYEQLAPVFRATNHTNDALNAWQQAIYCYSMAASRAPVGAAAGSHPEINADQRIAACYTEIANLQVIHSNYEDALLAYLEACQISQLNDDRVALAQNYYHLSVLYFEQEQFAHALTWAQKSLKLAAEQSNQGLVGRLLNTVGVLYKYRGDAHEALRYYQQALRLRQQIDDKAGIADTQHNIGILYEEQGDTQNALQYYTSALALRRELNDESGLLRTYAVLGTVHRQMDRHELANNYLQRALQIAEDNDDTQMQANLYKELAEVQVQLKDFERALECHQRFAELNERVWREQRLLRSQKSEREQQSAVKLASAADENVARAKTALRKRIDEAEKRLRQTEQRLVERDAQVELLKQREKELVMHLQRSHTREDELDEIKAQVIKAISHEFRTPLAVIANASYMLERFAQRLPDDKKAQNFKRINHSVNGMKEVLDDVCWIETATSDNVELSPEPVRLYEVIERAIGRFNHEKQPALRDRLAIRLPQRDVHVRLDSEAVEQVVFHIVNNALKFSQSDFATQELGVRQTNEKAEKVHLHVDWKHDRLRIIVADRGIGIPVNDQPHIFDLFFRASNADNVRGLGLGLTIVRKLVASADGIVEVDSHGPGAGCRVTVTLPCPEVTVQLDDFAAAARKIQEKR